MRGALVATAFVLVVASGLGAQSPTADSRPSFEVASVRPNTSGSGSMSVGVQPGGRFTATNMPLRQLITNAYRLHDFQLLGGPDWMSDRYDVIAKAEAEIQSGIPGTISPLSLMLQSLLAERFKLVARRETREMPIYALILARADGKLGPQLRPSTVDCEELRRTKQPIPQGSCGMRAGPGKLAAGTAPLSLLVSNLAVMTKRVVVDRTGLTGSFDISLQWAPDGSADTSAPSIFTALQEQLGLKLESERGPVDVVVVESIQRPTPD